MSPPALSVVVIGRNEGGRLTTCLQSVLAARMPHPVELIYVDSHSTDDSPVRAQALGATVVALSAGALSAARARNAGWRAATAPFILFLDGDTVLHADFIQRAFPEFVNPDVAVVWGHRRELRPHASVYNRVLDLDWIAPPGYSEFCGGDSLMRRERLECTGGFDPDLIAGEEPDLCRRIRGGGGRILHVDVPMTGHDFAIRHFSQYWRRAVRTGYAYAEVSARYRHSPDPLWTRDAGINLRRGPLYLLVGVGLTATALVAQSLLPLVAAALAGAIVATRTAVLARWKKAPWGTLMLFGIHSHLQHVPIWQGQMLYLWARWRGRKRELIEYKSTSS